MGLGGVGGPGISSELPGDWVSTSHGGFCVKAHFKQAGCAYLGVVVVVEGGDWHLVGLGLYGGTSGGHRKGVVLGLAPRLPLGGQGGGGTHLVVDQTGVELSLLAGAGVGDGSVGSGRGGGGGSDWIVRHVGGAVATLVAVLSMPIECSVSGLVAGVRVAVESGIDRIAFSIFAILCQTIGVD